MEGIKGWDGFKRANSGYTGWNDENGSHRNRVCHAVFYWI